MQIWRCKGLSDFPSAAVLTPGPSVAVGLPAGGTGGASTLPTPDKCLPPVANSVEGMFQK